MKLRAIDLMTPCDRCGHSLRQHQEASYRGGSICRVRGCPCDGYFAVRKQKPQEEPDAEV